jgi:hypothetical protein
MSTNTRIKLNMDSLKTRREWKRHKVIDGHNFYRILPPFGENSNGYPYKKWSIIWGLFDPESGRSRPFASSITSEKKCPVLEYVNSLKKRAEQIKNQMQQDGSPEDAIKDRLATLNKLISDLNPKTVYIYNAANQAGEVGLLEIKSTAQKKMKAEMTSYISDYNQDPTSLNSDDSDSGVWFDIVRTGMGRDTEYDVKKKQVKTKNPTTGKISFEDDRSALPESVVENYDSLAYDLTAVYQVKTYDELVEILEANMESIIENCPDADCNTDATFERVVLTAPTKTTSVVKPTGQKPVALRMDDPEEEEETLPAPKTAIKAKLASKAVVADDDDFLAQADALLNS